MPRRRGPVPGQSRRRRPALKGLVKEHEQLSKGVAEGGPLLGDLAYAQAAIRLREVMEQEEFVLEQVDGATSKLLAEKVESERL